MMKDNYWFPTLQFSLAKQKKKIDLLNLLLSYQNDGEYNIARVIT